MGDREGRKWRAKFGWLSDCQMRVEQFIVARAAFLWITPNAYSCFCMESGQPNTVACTVLRQRSELETAGPILVGSLLLKQPLVEIRVVVSLRPGVVSRFGIDREFHVAVNRLERFD